MIQIEKEDYLRLCQWEKELNELFENIVYQYVKEWCELNPKKRFSCFEKKDIVSDYVNKKIVDNNIEFNGNTPHVWFNSQGSGDMLYWSTKSSQSVKKVDDILKEDTYQDASHLSDF